jgi:glutamate synthase domain-containing protein 2
MFSLGCIQALRCHTNTCPTGITTHNPRLQRGLVVEEKYLRVANYCKGMNHDIEMIAHSCGVEHPRLLRARALPHRAGERPLDVAEDALSVSERRRTPPTFARRRR